MANLKEMQYMTSAHHMSASLAPSGSVSVDNASAAFHVHHNPQQEQQGFEPAASVQTSDVRAGDLLEESGRGCRTKRKQTNPIFCPVCSITVRPNELEAHYLAELSKLDKLSANGGKRRLSSTSTSGASGSTAMSTSPGQTTSTSSAPGDQPPAEVIAPEKCWETYQNVKANRQSRLKLKSRKRKNDDVTCPVCNNSISGDLNQHVEDCLRKNGDSGEDDDEMDEDIDVGGDDFGEYEWAGQHRVRASSMLEGGYSAAGIGTCLTRINKSVANDEEEDLVVDGDDSDKYGPAQYTERDIMLVSKGEDKDQTALRLAIIGSSNGDSSNNSLSKASDSEAKIRDFEWNNDDDDAEEDEANDEQQQTSTKTNKNPTVEALKQRVRELEKCENNKGQYKCLICMGRYKTPVISICCWHVHCELCWLKTLGIKKLCPQCNMITSPTDLRKVYI